MISYVSDDNVIKNAAWREVSFEYSDGGFPLNVTKELSRWVVKLINTILVFLT